MPPKNTVPNTQNEKLLPPGHKEPIGPTVGIVIIVILMIVGALYFWGASMNRQNPNANLPFISGDSATTTTQ